MPKPTIPSNDAVCEPQRPPLQRYVEITLDCRATFRVPEEAAIAHNHAARADADKLTRAATAALKTQEADDRASGSPGLITNYLHKLRLGNFAGKTNPLANVYFGNPFANSD